MSKKTIDPKSLPTFDKDSLLKDAVIKATTNIKYTHAPIVPNVSLKALSNNSNGNVCNMIGATLTSDVLIPSKEMSLKRSQESLKLATQAASNIQNAIEIIKSLEIDESRKNDYLQQVSDIQKQAHEQVQIIEGKIADIEKDETNTEVANHLAIATIERAGAVNILVESVVLIQTTAQKSVIVTNNIPEIQESRDEDNIVTNEKFISKFIGYAKARSETTTLVDSGKAIAAGINTSGFAMLLVPNPLLVLTAQKALIAGNIIGFFSHFAQYDQEKTFIKLMQSELIGDRENKYLRYSDLDVFTKSLLNKAGIKTDDNQRILIKDILKVHREDSSIKQAINARGMAFSIFNVIGVTILMTLYIKVVSSIILASSFFLAASIFLALPMIALRKVMGKTNGKDNLSLTQQLKNGLSFTNTFNAINHPSHDKLGLIAKLQASTMYAALASGIYIIGGITALVLGTTTGVLPLAILYYGSAVFMASAAVATFTFMQKILQDRIDLYPDKNHYIKKTIIEGLEVLNIAALTPLALFHGLAGGLYYGVKTLINPSKENISGLRQAAVNLLTPIKLIQKLFSPLTFAIKTFMRITKAKSKSSEQPLTIPLIRTERQVNKSSYRKIFSCVSPKMLFRSSNRNNTTDIDPSMKIEHSNKRDSIESNISNLSI